MDPAAGFQEYAVEFGGVLGPAIFTDALASGIEREPRRLAVGLESGFDAGDPAQVGSDVDLLMLRGARLAMTIGSER
jgi:hypothetical protein